VEAVHRISNVSIDPVTLGGVTGLLFVFSVLHRETDYPACWLWFRRVYT
jgi:hypothetical protein